MSNTPPVAETFTCNRDGLKLDGVSYAAGQTIPGEVVARIPRASALLSRRWIIPSPDSTHGKTPPHVPQPTHLPVSTRENLLRS